MTHFLPKNIFLKVLFMAFLIYNTNVNAQDYYLDFAPGNKVTTPATVSELDGANKFTIEAKVNMDSWNSAQNILKKSNTLSDRINLQLSNGLVYGIVSNGTNANKHTSNSVIGLHEWHHIAMVYDGTLTAANRVKLYVDGVLQTSTVSFSTIPTTAPTNASPVELAADTFDGKIDEVRVWKEALSEATINSWKDIDVEASHPNYANLKIYWNFNDYTTTTTAYGSEGTTYNGIITGATYSNEVIIAPNNDPVKVEKPYVGGYLPYYKISSVNSNTFDYLTHLFYFSFGPNTNGDLGRVDSSGNFTALSDITTVNSDISTLKTLRGSKTTKIFVTIGGWVQSDYLDEVAASATARDNLAQNVKNFCITNGLDGVDIDWEAYNGAVNDANYGLLVNAIKSAFAGTTLQLSVTIDPTHYSLADEFAPVDFVQIMSYGQRIGGGTQVSLSMLQGYVDNWANAGVPRYKLVTGLPDFARKTTGSESLTYQYIVDTYDPVAAADTVIEGGNTYYFNGINTIKQKAQYVVDSNLLGVVFWELGQDKDVSHPKSLLKAVTEVITVNNSTLGANNFETKLPEVTLYPNPFTDKLTVNFKLPFSDKIKVYVYNSNGSLVNRYGSNNLHLQGNCSFDLDVTNLKTGVYMLKVIDNNQFYTTKILKN